MKYSFLKASLLMSLTFNLANAGGFIDIGGGMNKFKIKDTEITKNNTEITKNNPSLTLGVGANLDLNEKTFLTFGFETSANFGEAKNEYNDDNFSETTSEGLNHRYTTKLQETEKFKNTLSNFLYLGLGFKVNDKFKVYGKLGLAHEMNSKNYTYTKTIKEDIFNTQNIIISGVQINNLVSSSTSTISFSESKKYNFIGFGYGVGASYQISSSKALNLEYLVKDTSYKKNGKTTKINNQFIKVSYRMFF
jgi:opacity protein-like surface antigen